MRHQKGFKQLNRTHSHRKALYRNMTEALLKREKITTTEVKAKEIRRIVEKIITKAKVNSLHNIRIVSKMIKDKELLMKLFNEVAPRYVDRTGGYTRVIKIGKRQGDGAEMAVLELVEEVVAKKKKKKKKVDLKKAKTEEAKTEEVKTEEVKAEEVKAEEVKTEEVKTEETDK